MTIKDFFTGVLRCNSLLVRHNLEIGAFTATYKKASELKEDDIVLVLEKIGGEHGNADNK